MNSHGQPKSQLQYSTYLPSILQFLLAMFSLPVRLPLFLIPARGKLAGFWVTPQETFEHGSPYCRQTGPQRIHALCGSRMENSLYSPALLSTLMLPPCCCVMIS